MGAPGFPLGFLGVVSPMTTLGLAPFSYLGVAYRDGIALASAALYQVTFSRQQERIVDDLMTASFVDLAARDNVHVYPRADIEKAELSRQFVVGYRVNLTRLDGSVTRLIVQGRRVDEIRRCLPLCLGDDNWADATLATA